MTRRSVRPDERIEAVVLQSGRRGAEGQIIVIAALALVAIIGMVGLAIDGSALFAQQRIAQNGADAASTAGTLVVAENLGSVTDIRTDHDVYVAVNAIAAANGLAGLTAVYTDDTGAPIGFNVTDTIQPIPPAARGVKAGGSRVVSTSFSRVLGFDQLTASADATVVAGKASGECTIDEENACTLLPVTFPVQTYECDSRGDLIPGTGTWIGAPPPGASPTDPYWELVGAESLPSAANPTGDTSKMAILPLCKSASNGSGAFGWLDLDPGIPNLAGEVDGPLTVAVDVPDWFQTQAGNPNSVDDEISNYIHKRVLIPLNNGACRVDPGTATTCPVGMEGKDPVGNNTWYYVHTLGNFYIDQVLVQGSNVDDCASPPGHPLVPVSSGGGFLGCLKGWFLNYVTSGPIVPGEPIIRGQTSIAIQLIK
jgi:Putative Flp pilus-assembly TadE/G-like